MTAVNPADEDLEVRFAEKLVSEAAKTASERRLC
jgi:hypothetical protein